MSMAILSVLQLTEVAAAYVFVILLLPCCFCAGGLQASAVCP